MAQYYYFMSSLPSLSFSLTDLPSLEDLWESTASVVSERDRSAIRTILDSALTREEGILLKWQKFERDLRRAIACYRSGELRRSGGGVYDSNIQLEIWYILQGLFERTNPLEREQFLIDRLFATLEDWSVSLRLGVFSSEALIVYFLKLKLLSRRRSFLEELGKKNFDTVYSKLKDKILNNDGGIL